MPGTSIDSGLTTRKSSKVTPLTGIEGVTKKCTVPPKYAWFSTVTSFVIDVTASAAFTANVKLVVVDPAKLVAVIVYEVDASLVVGVPVMEYVVELKIAHAGRDGEIEHDEIVEPFSWRLVGVMLIAPPTMTSTSFAPSKLMLGGCTPIVWSG